MQLLIIDGILSILILHKILLMVDLIFVYLTYSVLILASLYTENILKIDQTRKPKWIDITKIFRGRRKKLCKNGTISISLHSTSSVTAADLS